MNDNEIRGQQQWVLVELGGVLILARPAAIEMASHVVDDTDAEWAAYLSGLAK